MSAIGSQRGISPARPNLYDVRRQRGLTVSGLSEKSGVPKASISAIEDGEQASSLEMFWRLSEALNVEFGRLLGSEDQVVYDPSGISAQLVAREAEEESTETYLMSFPADASRLASGHWQGVLETVTVLSGALITGPEAQPLFLSTGQTASFQADGPHIYRSGSRPCRALVVVKYPKSKVGVTAYDKDITWPEAGASNGWSNVRDLLARAKVEVQNGLPLERITFRTSPDDPAEAARRLRSELNPAEGRNSAQIAATRTFVTTDPSLAVSTVFRAAQMGLIPRNPRLSSDVVKHCRELAKAAMQCRAQDTDTRQGLVSTVATGSTTVEAALAAEALTRSGEPTVPPDVTDAELRNHHFSDVECTDRHFEDRIDVNAYEAYELVHPAYARQMLAVAEFMPTFRGGETPTILDVGAGPGVPLKMLLELRPELHAVAVDPSPTAFAHFETRFASDDRVRGINASVTEYRNEGVPFSAAISVGASHHLDTMDFLESIAAQLDSGTVLIVSDEMISPFGTGAERDRNLLVHHLWYVLDTLVDISNDADDGERALAQLLSARLPEAMIAALAGESRQAVRIVRLAYEEAASIPLPATITHPLAAFPRFHMLELQALIAGFDYEVEQKTYPARFIDMAKSCGFDCRRHLRLYATDGIGDRCAGTHVFALARR
ncbi:MAG: helix-turn-helix domain-containing protein [Inquilinus sp.]|nr:helix-turn-helix domain-containing protein [Inquilinus sp.]